MLSNECLQTTDLGTLLWIWIVSSITMLTHHKWPINFGCLFSAFNKKKSFFRCMIHNTPTQRTHKIKSKTTNFNVQHRRFNEFHRLYDIWRQTYCWEFIFFVLTTKYSIVVGKKRFFQSIWRENSWEKRTNVNYTKSGFICLVMNIQIMFMFMFKWLILIQYNETV